MIERFHVWPPQEGMGMPNESPDQFPMVIPMLVCDDAASEIEFCRTAFGAVELSRRPGQDGAVVHATLAIGKVVVMVHGVFHGLASRAPQPDGSSPVVIYIYLQNADNAMDRAVAAGARVLMPATNQFWGDRVGRIIDPAGHVWNVASRVETAFIPAARAGESES